MDKALAARSGLGWYGKNTNILTERFGSFVLLGEIVTTLPLPPDAPLPRDCGSCRLCVAACPTGALGPDYQIDSRKCISYLTIEHRGPIPRELRPAMGSWVFGCDVCQDVCPPTMEPHLKTQEERRAWLQDVRRHLSEGDDAGAPGDALSHPSTEPRSGPFFEGGIRPAVDLLWLLAMSHDEYVEAFRGSAIKRAKDWMLRRNAAVALGNLGDPQALPALVHSMEADDHPVVRGHAAWAVGRLADRISLREGVECLERARDSERNTSVLEEIALALEDVRGKGLLSRPR